MSELEMNGSIVQLNFGMGFLRRINREVSIPVDGAPGLKEDVGLRYAVGGLLEGDVNTLVNVLYTANTNCEQRVTKDFIDKFIEDETTDIDKVFEDVLGFLKNSNATKKGTISAIENVEKANKLREAKLKAQMEAMA
ncbi:Phage protein [[Eubacterium] contortum]|uniref:Phage protein n=1 Tax=Faecalicatena contorta TaxID=39482 RepID=A0A174MDL1_9FIRM|nr:tail assembly chaperone [Faecalicatena contorta]CUP33201.1 Phage protein [[Eubacterium] contortum] [Faecalicatena contorta]